jgi:hypothetical protein
MPPLMEELGLAEVTPDASFPDMASFAAAATVR